MSSELRILYSLPSSLISVPPYLLTSTRSPFLTSTGIFFPSSSVLPVPRATTIPSVGFSLAVSGMMMPPFLVSFSSAGSTRTRSPRGFRLMAIVVMFLFVSLLLQSTPAALAAGKKWLCRARSPRRRSAKSVTFSRPRLQRRSHLHLYRHQRHHPAAGRPGFDHRPGQRVSQT